MTTTVWMAVLMMTMFTEAYSVNNNYNNNNNYRRSRPEGSFISLFNEVSDDQICKIDTYHSINNNKWTPCPLGWTATTKQSQIRVVNDGYSFTVNDGLIQS